MVSKKLKSFNADEFMEGTANNYSLLNDRFRPEADVLDVSTKSGIGQCSNGNDTTTEIRRPYRILLIADKRTCVKEILS